MRRHYVTLCVHGNTVVTYTRTDSGVEVTFEQAKNKGFNTAVMDLDGGIISNDGFPPAETDYFQRFLQRNRDIIAEGALEESADSVDYKWVQIREDYDKAKSALWDAPHMDNWRRDEESGYYYMWKAYREAKSAETKDHLIYARVLVMVSRERRYLSSEYDRFHKYVSPALDEYRQAVESGQLPTKKELDSVQWEYDALSYQLSRADAPYDEQIKAIQGYEKLSEFCFYDSQVISFSHSEHCAKLTLQYRAAIATFSFDDVYEIQMNADPAVVYVTEFCCYPCFENKSMIRFDIGDYQITCKSISVESVEFDLSG